MFRTKHGSRAWSLAFTVSVIAVTLACSAEANRLASQGPTVIVSPTNPTLLPGASVQFVARATGLSSSDVTWSIEEVGTGGTIDPTGLYTAPATEGFYHVVATSVAAPQISGTAQVNVSTLVPSGIIPDARRTTWNPGIPGGVPDSSAFTVQTTVQLAAGTGAAAANLTAIQSAITAAGAVATAASPRVVQLPAGIYYVGGTILFNQNYVVLRGAGPDVGGQGTGTRLVQNNASTSFFRFGGYPAYPASAVDVAADIPKGSSSFTLVAGHGVRVGDLLTLDMVDDATITLGGGTWYKRGPTNSDNGPVSAGGYRSVGQTVEVTGVSGNVITIAGIVHHAMPLTRAPQVFLYSTLRRGGYVGMGLESMTITGWGPGVGGVNVLGTRRSWIKNVEFDGLPTAQGGVGPGTEGVDTRIVRSVRFMLEHCYLHHSRTYITDNHAYSVSLAEQTSDSLIWDNIVWFKNKNIVMEASGPGNVIAYNYVEDPVINAYPPSTGWMEMGIDATHLSHPMYDLFEGNYTAKMGGADTHGGASSQTFFRNFSKGDRLYTMTPNAAVGAVFFQEWMHEMNVVGNVLNTRSTGDLGGAARIYEPTILATGYISFSDSRAWKIYRLGFQEGNWEGPVPDLQVEATLLRVGNWDNVRNQIDATPSEALPPSLFTATKPPFFGPNDAWPWVDPYGGSDAARVKTLPAQARFVAGTFL